MIIDLKPFVKLLKQKETKKAREWLEQNKTGLGPEDEFAKGYFLALQGMISALDVGGELSVIKRILNGEYRREQIEKFIKETNERILLKLRPRDEQGFDTAWVEIIGELYGEKQEDDKVHDS